MAIKDTYKTFKYRLKPTKALRLDFAQMAGSARFIYNYMLDICLKADRYPGYTELANMLPKMKKNPKYAWLKEVPSQILQQAIKDLDKTVRSSFKSGKKLHFRKKGIHSSFRLPQFVTAKDGKAQLPKIGEVKYWDSRLIEGTIKQTTIKEIEGHWHIFFHCELEIEVPERQMRKEYVVGIDVGIHLLLSLSTGEVVVNPRYYKKGLDKLKFLQRKLSKAKRGSKNYYEIRKKLAAVSGYIARLRRDHYHKITTWLSKSYDGFALEDLNILGMMKNHKLAQSIADASWGIFKRFLIYKAEATGKPIAIIDRFYPSSKTCSSCKAKQDMPLNIRIFKCISCGFTLDRDINAAKNIRIAGLSILQSNLRKPAGEMAVATQ